MGLISALDLSRPIIRFKSIRKKRNREEDICSPLPTGDGLELASASPRLVGPSSYRSVDGGI